MCVIKNTPLSVAEPPQFELRTVQLGQSNYYASKSTLKNNNHENSPEDVLVSIYVKSYRPEKNIITIIYKRLP